MVSGLIQTYAAQNPTAQSTAENSKVAHWTAALGRGAPGGAGFILASIPCSTMQLNAACAATSTRQASASQLRSVGQAGYEAPCQSAHKDDEAAPRGGLVSA